MLGGGPLFMDNVLSRLAVDGAFEQIVPTLLREKGAHP